MELSEQTVAPQANKTLKKRLFTPLVIFLNLLILLALIASAVYFFFFFNKKASDEAEQTQTKQATTSASKKDDAFKAEVTYVSAQEGLNLRSQPDTNSSIILLLPYGTELKIIGTEEEWYYVEAQTKGFVAKEFTSIQKPTIAIKTFSDKDSPFNFLYHDVYKVDFSKKEGVFEYSFSGNDSYGGFSVEKGENLLTLGNYSLQHYPNGKTSTCGQIRFGAGTKECEKVETDSGTTYLVLVNSQLYKFNYLKTEGGLLSDINNIVFYSLYFK